ncbi:MAG: hypothetical protein IPK59_03930 [Rhodospirillaceae bacterium]|nr:hypothetical protein [Rhodospirillaceae bacterium]
MTTWPFAAGDEVLAPTPDGIRPGVVATFRLREGRQICNVKLGEFRIITVDAENLRLANQECRQ